MESPLAPVLAHLFMGHNEKLWVGNLQGTPPFYCRIYVDDMFSFFNNSFETKEFFNYIDTRKNNYYPPFILDKNIKAYIVKIRYDNNKVSSEVNKLLYFILPYMGKYSEQVQRKIAKLCTQYCKENNVKIVFTLFKISNHFSLKDSKPSFLQSFLVYKFVCVRCKSCYIGKNWRRFITRIDEHIENDKESHVFQQLRSKEKCSSSFDLNCFSN